jgi:nucleoside-diphosphate-sugar epimerase
MQTILGAGGIIGKELAKFLPTYTKDIRLVSRNPQKINNTDTLFKADLTQSDQVMKAVEGSKVVYLTVGLKYNIKVWQSTWPIIMQNVIEACENHKAKLVFFDNIYMYDPAFLNHLTEETPLRPTSKKGKVRKQLDSMIMNEVEKGNLTAIIARAADFYGPGIQDVSVLIETVFKPLHHGKKANWLGSLNKIHSYTFTPDAGKATAMLGNTEDAYNQVWHLPTDKPAKRGREWIESIAREMGVKPRVQVAPKFMVRIMGLFVPVMREFVEMMYQYDRDYFFDSSKFENAFHMKPTPYVEGIRQIVEKDF